MPWIKIRIQTSKAHAEEMAGVLEQQGAIAVTSEDAGDLPVFKTAPLEAPLWDELFITGLFPQAAAVEEILGAIQQYFNWPAPPACEVEELPDQDWERSWMSRFHARRFGEKLWVVPSWEDSPDPEAVNIVMDPGLAFGTGTHATTALCMEWLAEQSLRDKTVIDYGCGSGILAIAALKLGARQAWGVDIDLRALDATENNARQNGVAERLIALTPASLPPAAQADVVIANILADTLVQLSSQLIGLVNDQGVLLLSGVLGNQVEQVMESYRQAFDFSIRTREEWALLIGTRSGD